MTTEKKPHKHAEILRAIADGITVQFREYRNYTWIDRQDDPDAVDPITHDFYEWRIKPEVKPDIIAKGHFYYNSAVTDKWDYEYKHGPPNVEFIFCGETYELINVKLIKE